MSYFSFTSNRKPIHDFPSVLRVKSSGRLMEDAGSIIKTSPRHWSMQRNVPWQVKASRDAAKVESKRQEIRNIIDDFKNKGKNTKPTTVLLVKKVKGGYRPYGFNGETLTKWDDVVNFAADNKRAYIRYGNKLQKVSVKTAAITA